MVDVEQNRSAQKYPRSILVKRILWGLVRPLFLFSPRPCFAWRRFLLRLFGAKVGRKAHIYNTATIYFPWNLEIGDYSAIGDHAYIYNLALVSIGARATISQRSHLCAGTHDYNKRDFPLLRLPISIGAQSWICADAFVGPSVRVGEGAIVGARAVVVKDVEPWTIVVGNPARFVKKREALTDA